MNIPYEIYIKVNSDLKKTGSIDRKGIVLNRIRHFLETGKIKKPTIYNHQVINFEKLPKPLKPSHPVYYG